MVGGRSHQKEIIHSYHRRVSSAAWFEAAKSLGKALIDASPVIVAADERKHVDMSALRYVWWRRFTTNMRKRTNGQRYLEGSRLNFSSRMNWAMTEERGRGSERGRERGERGTPTH